MSLQLYKKKRNFKKTAEPSGRRKKSGQYRFVVQEHHASHLHYDFRLELGGVLKSWAVPKGPPTEPKQKRLAVQVEDHPVEYASFEGQIPKGEYGAGHVLIWDQGHWKPSSRSPHKDLERGRLEFELQGERLSGSWLLIRTGRVNSRNWFLIKRSSSGVKNLNRTIGISASMPKFVEPQLAKLVSRPPAGENWLHEIKYDGYRIQCRIENGRIQFFTRSGLDWTERFSGLENPFGALKVRDAVIDGEVVAVDGKGRSDFHLLQEALKSAKTDRLIFYAFDLLYLDGRNLRDEALLKRKLMLKKTLEASSPERILFSEHWTGNAGQLLSQSCSLGLEGIVSKRTDAPYMSGRGDGWVKSKCVLNQEFVVVGYTSPKGARSGFGALLLGAYDEGGVLRYTGRVGTGFNQKEIKATTEKLKKLRRGQLTLAGKARAKPIAGEKLLWVKPKLVAQVQFAEWTPEGVLRHASFTGWREDKAPEEVLIDGVEPQAKAVAERRAVSVARKAERVSHSSSSKRITSRVKISNPDRIVFPDTGLTKQDLADYYQDYAPQVLQSIADRPLSLLRCPKGSAEKCFFQKHLTEGQASAVRYDKIQLKEEKGESERVISIDSAQGLVSLAQLGVIEFHPWGSHVGAIERPDMIVFDLDPSPGVGWTQMMEGAFALKELLEALELKSLLKVTGGKGLHLHVPIEPKYTWSEVKSFSKTIASKLASDHPTLYTAHLLKEKRRGKIFIDYLRNGYGATAVAPYSVRARPGAPVAKPVAWRELTQDLRGDSFQLKDMMSSKIKDMFHPWRGQEQLRQPLKIIDNFRNQRQ